MGDMGEEELEIKMIRLERHGYREFIRGLGKREPSGDYGYME